jgi:ATP-dependent DNA ligase
MNADKLYKIDTTGKTRVWWMEYDNEKYRTHSGIEGGKIVVSGWQYPEAKNVGRSNATTVAEQVKAEVDAEYTKKQNQGKYHTSVGESIYFGAKFFECMLADKYDPKKHNKFPYFSQPKLDGVRCLISKDGMQSRNGKPIVSCPHILEALDPFFQAFPDAVLDGELYNHELRDNFEKIISLVRKTKPETKDYIEASKLVQYHVYDVIMDGPFVDRLAFINRHISHGNSFGNRYYPIVQAVKTSNIQDEHDIQMMLGEYLESGYEGQMLRVIDSPYEGKRSRNLIKHKEFEDDEFEIVSIEEGKGNWAGAAKRIEIRLKDGTTQFAGVRGSFDMLKDLLYNDHGYTSVTVRYQNKTDDGKLRFPVVVAFWKGKRDL